MAITDDFAKVLNTRIQLKYDSYTNWTSNNPTLKPGEVAIATIQTNEDGVQNAPSILIKVGDGSTPYNNLKFVSGLSADVYAWAKASTKPTYTASEISGLADYISGEIQDTDTQYRIVKVDEFNFKLQSKTLSGSWTDVEGSTISIKDFTENITLLQNQIGLSENQITDIWSAISGIKDSETIDSFSDVETKFSELETTVNGKQDAGDYATKAEAQGYADAKDAAISAAKSNADTALINSSQNERLISTINSDISTIVGSDTGKSIRTISAEEVAKIVADAPESYDTLKEIADYIASDTTRAAELSNKINANTTAINNLANIAKTGNVNDLVQTSGDVLVLNCGDSSIGYDYIINDPEVPEIINPPATS